MSRQLDSVDSSTFDDAIDDKLVMVEFGADWCDPCKQLEPRLARVVEDDEGIECYSVGVDDNQDLAQRFNVRSIPTVLMFKHGEQIGELVGSVPREQIKDFIDEHRE